MTDRLSTRLAAAGPQTRSPDRQRCQRLVRRRGRRTPAHIGPMDPSSGDRSPRGQGRTPRGMRAPRLGRRAVSFSGANRDNADQAGSDPSWDFAVRFPRSDQGQGPGSCAAAGPELAPGANMRRVRLFGVALHGHIAERPLWPRVRGGGEPADEADQGRHPGLSRYGSLQGGPVSLSFSFGGKERRS